ncbi:unnamed protein product [Urochloa decumbens]|uniref:DUF7595 domain-containing protein n=1 Tax=Urochloa decumbens TaxID=240449 RepID=A0ABC8WJ80_9POAL
MPPRKRPRTSTPAPSSTPPLLALPADLLLQIAARSDVAAIVRCAATCKLLRREILSPAFIHSLCRRAPPPDGGVVPPRLVGFLGGRRRAFSVAHPRTPVAKSFARTHLASFVRRSAGDLLKQYKVVTARGGLAVLERREINRRRRSERRSDLCVYDPMTGERAFFPFPPNIHRGGMIRDFVYTYVVVTAADGIDRPFTLLAAGITSPLYFGPTVRVQAVSPDASGGGGQWGPLEFVSHRGSGMCLADTSNSAVVLRGVVHWLMRCPGDDVFTYDVVTGETGRVSLPFGLGRPEGRNALEAKLGATPDGRLTVTVANELTVSVWVQRTAGSGSRWPWWPDWEQHAKVDTEAGIRSVLGRGIEIRGTIKLVNFGDQRSGAVFFRIGVVNGRPGGYDVILVLDVETKEIRGVRRYRGTTLYEVDLASRLSAMKIL